MKPYYEDAASGIQIYCADCRDVLPTLGPVDLVLTDPPYGIDLHRSWMPEGQKRVGIQGDDEPFDPRHLMQLQARAVVLWGANNFSDSLPLGGWLCWDKRLTEKADRMYGSPFELAWCSDPQKFKMYRILHGGVVNADGHGERRHHPTQKPVSLMLWCLQVAKATDSVLDPYMGGGPVLVAAKQMGLPCIGIEIEERYCEIAAKRLAQGVLLLA